MRSRCSLLIIAVALLALTSCRDRPLLSDVSFSTDLITPNADRDNDVLLINYSLGRSARISICFGGPEGERYYFRKDAYRGPSVGGPYGVYFAGVVDGYTLPEDDFDGFVVEKRVLRDGTYTWIVEAVDDVGTRSGQMLELARRENWTLRQLYQHFAAARGHMVLVGTPSMVVDAMMTRRGSLISLPFKRTRTTGAGPPAIYSA